MTDAPSILAAYVIVAGTLIVYAAHLRRRIRSAETLRSALRARAASLPVHETEAHRAATTDGEAASP